MTSFIRGFLIKYYLFTSKKINPRCVIHVLHAVYSIGTAPTDEDFSASNRKLAE